MKSKRFWSIVAGFFLGAGTGVGLAIVCLPLFLWLSETGQVWNNWLYFVWSCVQVLGTVVGVIVWVFMPDNTITNREEYLKQIEDLEEALAKERREKLR